MKHIKWHINVFSRTLQYSCIYLICIRSFINMISCGKNQCHLHSFVHATHTVPLEIFVRGCFIAQVLYLSFNMTYKNNLRMFFSCGHFYILSCTEIIHSIIESVSGYFSCSFRWKGKDHPPMSDSTKTSSNYWWLPSSI